MPDTGNPGTAVPLDLASLIARDSGRGETEFAWPTPYGDYAFLSVEFVDRICKAARAVAATPELEVVVESKLGDLVTDLGVLARLCLDLRTAHELALSPVYDPVSSPWIDFLVTGRGDVTRLASLERWHFQAPRKVKAHLKRVAGRGRSDFLAYFSSKAGRHDVLSRNILLDECYSGANSHWIDISPNYHDWQAPAQCPRELDALVDAVKEAFADITDSVFVTSRTLGDASCRLAMELISEHFAKAWQDLQRVRDTFTEARAGSVLVGGTPKHIGRLIGWQYQQFGRQVVRFAHGGERAFYDDYTWSLAELPYCDRYMCHSRGEAVQLEQRRKEGRMAEAGPDVVEFVGVGSTKHQEIRQNWPRKPQARSGSVMYVAGGYLGEWLSDFPSRKPPDVLYFDWQVWLLRALKAGGFKAITKVHPRGIFKEGALLQPYSDEIVSGYFEPKEHDIDCYIFDFAGTAFFDALASNRGVVLVDMGIRPHDANSFGNLRQRCEIVECTLAEGNRFRVDVDALAEAIERASTARSWPELFFETYFGS